MPSIFIHFRLIGVFFALLLQYERVSTMECGTVNYVRPTILGGTVAIRGEWPFIAAIHKHSNYICGGTIISYRHILTAAHCIQRKYSETELSPHELVVRIGAYNLTNNNEKELVQRNVSTIFIHPDWETFEKRFDADIAILVLSENITFTDNIQPVCMPANGIAENMEGTVVGYGVRKSTIYAEIPRRISVRTVNSSHCFREDDIVRSYSSERTFCGGNGDGSPDLGDSGSGYFFTPGFSWAQYGIVAIVRTNSTGHVFPYAYHIYTNLTMFKDWITKTVNETGGVVGEARISVTMNCYYSYSEILYSVKLLYNCKLYNIDMQGNNFETGLFNGSHLLGKQQRDVEGIHFVNGTMSYLPSGFGFFFRNLNHLTVGGSTSDSGSLDTKAVRRSDLRNLEKLRTLRFLQNDIETLHEDALWDLSDLRNIVLIENKLKVLGHETFSKNRELTEAKFYSNRIRFLPANLFRNNPRLMIVDFKDNQLKTIDENFFETNRRLQLVDFSSNQIEMLPKRLFQNNFFLQLVRFRNNTLSSIDEDLFATNEKLLIISFASNDIRSLPRTLFQNNLHLYSVDLEKNSIKTIDEYLFMRNSKLTTVSFADNRLEHLHRNVFKNASWLDFLDLSKNMVNNIEIDFAEFEQIDVIDLRWNDCIDAGYSKQNVANGTTDIVFRNLVEFQNYVIAKCSKGF